jgi:hypothetical protein
LPRQSWEGSPALLSGRFLSGKSIACRDRKRSANSLEFILVGNACTVYHLADGTDSDHDRIAVLMRREEPSSVVIIFDPDELIDVMVRASKEGES